MYHVPTYVQWDSSPRSQFYRQEAGHLLRHCYHGNAGRIFQIKIDTLKYQRPLNTALSFKSQRTQQKCVFQNCNTNMSTTGFWYLICGRIPKLMFHLPHYNLSNSLLSTVTNFCTSFQSRDPLRAGRHWDRIPVAARFSAPVQTGFGAHPVPYAMDTWPFISFISIQPLGRFQQEPEPSQATGKALAHCILGKFLGVGCHCFPPTWPLPGVNRQGRGVNQPPPNLARLLKKYQSRDCAPLLGKIYLFILFKSQLW